MSKIICLYSHQSSSWISCQKIVANLWASYKGSGEEVLSLHYGPEQKSQELDELAHQIMSEGPAVISFIDHRPHPYDLLQYLIPLWMKTHIPFPEIVFHVYGDFTLNYHKWASLSPLLKGVKLKFCVASTAQKKLIDKLIPEETFIVPFSVDSEEFYYDPALRKKTRKELQVSEKEKVFIFTGRLSYQKNIHLLVSEFLKYLDQTSSLDKLLIFGHFDDLGDSFAGYTAMNGHYFHLVNDLMKNHPRKNQIRFMGMANSQELNAYYNASDYFINLSVHNDEDFGMSVAEASLCGLASIMTAWGGLNDFHFPPNKYLKVTIDGSKEVDLSPLLTLMSGPHDYHRGDLAQQALNTFSISQSTQTIKEMLSVKSRPFGDFSELFYKVQRSFLYTEKVYLDYQHRLNSLYKELYDSYLG